MLPTNCTKKLWRFDLHSFKYILFTVTVEGESLWPELIPGKTYFATNIRQPRIGDYAVFQNPGNKKEFFVKKIHKITNGRSVLNGTVSWSSSFVFPPNRIIGTVIY